MSKNYLILSQEFIIIWEDHGITDNQKLNREAIDGSDDCNSDRKFEGISGHSDSKLITCLAT